MFVIKDQSNNVNGDLLVICHLLLSSKCSVFQLHGIWKFVLVGGAGCVIARTSML